MLPGLGKNVVWCSRQLTFYSRLPGWKRSRKLRLAQGMLESCLSQWFAQFSICTICFCYLNVDVKILCLVSTVQWEEWYLRISSSSCLHYCPQIFCMVWVNMLLHFSLTQNGPDRHCFPETRGVLLRYIYELHCTVYCCKIDWPYKYCPVMILTMNVGCML